MRRYRDKFGIPFPLLLAGINDVEAAGETLPQLHGFTSFPTTIFLGRDGRVRRVHAGFYGPAMGAQHEQLIKGFEREIETAAGGEGEGNGERVLPLFRPLLALDPASFASGSTRSPMYSPAMAWPGTPQSIQYHPACSASEGGSVDLTCRQAGLRPSASWRCRTPGRPPSVGSFSRSAMTTRLWTAFESAERQSHWTVQPSGTMTCRSRPPIVR